MEGDSSEKELNAGGNFPRDLVSLEQLKTLGTLPRSIWNWTGLRDLLAGAPSPASGRYLGHVCAL